MLTLIVIVCGVLSQVKWEEGTLCATAGYNVWMWVFKSSVLFQYTFSLHLFMYLAQNYSHYFRIDYSIVFLFCLFFKFCILEYFALLDHLKHNCSSVKLITSFAALAWRKSCALCSLIISLFCMIVLEGGNWHLAFLYYLSMPCN